MLKHGLVTENVGKYMKRLVCAGMGILLSEEERWIASQNERCRMIPSFCAARIGFESK